MREFWLIGIGAWLGAGSRYLLGQWLTQCFPGNFPIGTLFVNASGCLLLGLLGTLFLKDPGLRLLLAVGFLGSFTTFSTFSLETIELWRRGLALHASGYALLSLALGLAATFLGFRLGRLLPW